MYLPHPVSRPISRGRGSSEAGWVGESVKPGTQILVEDFYWQKTFAKISSSIMRALLILGGLSLVLTAPQTQYTKAPAKSCHLELTKDKAGNEECFEAQPECKESCKPGEPVSWDKKLRGNLKEKYLDCSQVCHPEKCEVQTECKIVDQDRCSTEIITKVVDK